MERIILILAVFCLLSHADSQADRASRRQQRQRARIAEGVQSGELTQGEVANLKSGQRRIRHARKKAAADGVVTDQEKLKLEKMEDHQSRKIYRKKHNGKTTENPNPNAAIPATGN